MYADKVTPAMQTALDETNRRRQIQAEYNQKHGIEPASITKTISDITERVTMGAIKEEGADYQAGWRDPCP